MAITKALSPSGIVDARTVETESNGMIKAATVRYYISQREFNGLQPHTLRVGRQLVLCREGFAEWLAARAGKA